MTDYDNYVFERIESILTERLEQLVAASSSLHPDRDILWKYIIRSARGELQYVLAQLERLKGIPELSASLISRGDRALFQIPTDASRLGDYLDNRERRYSDYVNFPCQEGIREIMEKQMAIVHAARAINLAYIAKSTELQEHKPR